MDCLERQRSVMPRAVVFAWIGSLTLVVCSGCSRGGGAIDGQVKRADGQPLPNARIIARCEVTGSSANAITDSAGAFRLASDKGLVDGEYVVVISEWRGDDQDNPLPETIASKYLSPDLSDVRFQIPDQYGKPLEITLDPPSP